MAVTTDSPLPGAVGTPPAGGREPPGRLRGRQSLTRRPAGRADGRSLGQPQRGCEDAALLGGHLLPGREQTPTDAAHLLLFAGPALRVGHEPEAAALGEAQPV